MGAGAGSNEPEGIITGASEVIETAGEGALAVADLEKIQEALGARWQPRARWLGSLTAWNAVNSLVATADAEHPLIVGQDGSILRKPFSEVSTMSVKPTTSGEKILLSGTVRVLF